VLHHFVGYAPSEIAEMLGQPPGTIRSRLHHAHRAMRAALDAEARASIVGGTSG
jgi:DNA-directed RNA polymerase specialized sigma24 family protein